MIKDATPQCPGTDFAYRNSLIDSGQFNGDNAAGQPYVMLPAREMGQNDHGTSTSLKVDTTPLTTSYLRFSVTGLSGAGVAAASLRICASSTLSAGFSVRTVSDDTWTETGIVAANAPPYAASGVNSGAVTSGNCVAVNVTSLITATSGDINLALVGLSSTNLSLASREVANKQPQLTITTA